MVLSIVLGTLIAVARLSARPRGRIPLIGAGRGLRGLPVVVLVYFGVRVLPDIGLDFARLARRAASCGASSSASPPTTW